MAEGWMEEDELLLLQSLEAEAAEKANRADSAAPAHAPLADQEKGAQKALAETIEDAERARQLFTAHGELSREAFVSSVPRLLRLVLDGLTGCIHSIRSLRNYVLRLNDGDGRSAVESALEVDLTNGIDNPDVVAACLGGIGLPLALALPLWQRLRRIGLAFELCGHEARSVRGRMLCVMVGVVTEYEPLEAAALHTLWFALCRRELLVQAEVSELVGGLMVSDLKAKSTLHVVLKSLAHQEIPEEEWVNDLDQVSAVRARIIARQLLKDPERASRANARIRTAP